MWLDDLVTWANSRLTERELDVLLGRGVSSEQVQAYNLGHLNGELPDGLPDHFVNWAANKVDDVFLLPLTTTTGEIKGLQLRHVERSKPGYQDYFLDRSESCLFGLGQAVTHMWESGTVTLVEGAFDLFPVQRAFPNVVATLTAHVSDQFYRILRRIVHSVVMCYDNDTGGRKGTYDFKSSYGKQFEVYVVKYPQPGVKDPAVLWEMWGDAQLIPYLQNVIKQEM